MGNLINNLFTITPARTGGQAARVELGEKAILVHPRKGVTVLTDRGESILVHPVGEAHMRVVPVSSKFDCYHGAFKYIVRIRGWLTPGRAVQCTLESHFPKTHYTIDAALPQHRL